MQVFYSQMCDLIKLGLNGRVFQCPHGGRLFFPALTLERTTILCKIKQQITPILLSVSGRFWIFFVKNGFFIRKIWSIQKKAVTLQSLS